MWWIVERWRDFREVWRDREQLVGELKAARREHRRELAALTESLAGQRSHNDAQAGRIDRLTTELESYRHECASLKSKLSICESEVESLAAKHVREMERVKMETASYSARAARLLDRPLEDDSG